MLLVLLVGLAPVSTIASPAPVAVVRADEQFLDDGFCVSSDGERMAYVRTDGSAEARVEIVRLPDGQREGAFPLPALAAAAGRLAFTSKGNLLIVQPGKGGKEQAQLYGPLGKRIGRAVGPADRLTLALREGATLLVSSSERRQGVKVVREVSAIRIDDGKAMGRRSLADDAEGLVKVGAPLKVMYLTDGGLRLVGQRKGEYDKANDLRRPDRAVTLDVLSGKTVEEHEIGDVIEWVKIAREHDKHPNLAAMATYTEDLAGLELITAAGERRPIVPPRPLAKYEPKSLEQRIDPSGERLYFSLTVDPVNAEAVKNRKADVEVVDLYAVDLKGGTPRRILQDVKTGEVPLTWAVGGGRVAVMKKHKGFGRGGTEIAVYDF